MFFHGITNFQQTLKMIYLVKLLCQVAFTACCHFQQMLNLRHAMKSRVPGRLGYTPMFLVTATTTGLHEDSAEKGLLR